MITAITLQNFKGIGEQVRIPLKPITLMFGANSSGKSTIIQAIHYAREILERNNVDPDKTLAGGTSIDLGGFRNLVHNHDLDLPITLRFDLDLTNVDLPDYTRWARPFGGSEYPQIDVQDISANVQSAFVEIVVVWSKVKDRPIVKSYLVGLNGEEIVRSTASTDEAQFTLEVNPLSKVFMNLLGDEFGFEMPFDATAEPSPWYDLTTKELTSAVPTSWDRPLLTDRNPFLDDEIFSVYLAQMMLGPGKILSSLLRTFRYLGPLRSIPERNHQPALTPDESRWSDGTAAWDALYRPDDDTLLIELHHWMSEERLKTGYGIFLDKFRAIPSHSDLYAALTSNTLLDDIENIAEEFNKFPVRTRFRITTQDEKFLEVQPSDIGVGISQVVPVIVVALDTRDGIVAIEQPELHLHPAMQAELGDLFIESALGKTQNRFIIETHSEHLILRLLRRVRETNEDSLPSPDMRLTPSDVQILYIRQEGDGLQIYDLEITPDGEFADKWPGGFFPERAKELF